MSATARQLPGASQAAGLAGLAVLCRSRPVWVRVGQLLDGESALPLPGANLVFDAEQIHFVGDQSKTPPPSMLPAGATGPDATLPDYTVLPCLIEAHAHMFLEGAPLDSAQREQHLKLSAREMLRRARERIAHVIRCGVGTIRDAGDKYQVGLSLTRAAKSALGSLSEMAWIDSPGAALYHRGRYGAFMGEPVEDHATVADCVAERIAHGADRIKLLVSGIINFQAGRVTTPPQMPAEEVAAIVAAAKRQGRQTFAHASGAAGIENAIEGGATTVEHGFFVTRSQLQKMSDRGIGWVPTFAPVMVQIREATRFGWSREIVAGLERIIDDHRRMLCLAHDLGVPIVAGSDAGSCGVPHGVGLLDEMLHMEQAGLGSLAVVNSATGTSSRLLCFAEPVGRLARGYRSRLIFTEHNPLQSVAHLQLTKSIIYDGRLYVDDGQTDPQGM
jgi:imidazolonepropionase-like amidohydrolase